MKKSNRLKFILVGVLFAQVLEFQFNIQITKNYGNWVFTLIYYPIILLLAYWASRLIDKIIKNKRLADIIYFFSGGAFGLFIMEWEIIGNSPTGNPDASQIGMFSFWVAVLFMPRIFTNPDPIYNKLKHKIKVFFGSYAIITIILGFMLPNPIKSAVVIWGAIIGYIYMNTFYFRYIKKRPKQ